jgi:hypothetical protein
MSTKPLNIIASGLDLSTILYKPEKKSKNGKNESQ